MSSHDPAGEEATQLDRIAARSNREALPVVTSTRATAAGDDAQPADKET